MNRELYILSIQLYSEVLVRGLWVKFMLQETSVDITIKITETCKTATTNSYRRVDSTLLSTRHICLYKEICRRALKETIDTKTKTSIIAPHMKPYFTS